MERPAQPLRAFYFRDGRQNIYLQKKNWMKKHYAFFMLLLMSVSGFSQNVNIPDPVFKNYLVGNFDTSGDGEIQVSEAQAITSITLEALNVTDLTGLEQTHVQSLTINETGITSLDVSNYAYLVSLSIYYNQALAFLDASDCALLNNLNIGACDALLTANLSNTAITNPEISSCFGLLNLNFSGCANLQVLNLNTIYAIEHIEVSGCSALMQFTCTPNSLQTLEITDSPLLEIIQVDFGQLAELILACPNLELLSCTGNQLTSLDMSNCNGGVWLQAWDNLISYANFKNGQYDSLEDGLVGNPLAYICIDEEDDTSWLESEAATPFVINPYCTFVPGGDFNTVSGHATIDLDANGCDANDPPASWLRINVEGDWNGTVCTNASGDYVQYLPPGDYTFTPSTENLPYFVASPASAAANFPEGSYSQTAQDFCLSANGVHPDLEVMLFQQMLLGPGFDASYVMVYRNKGNQILSGTLEFSYDEAIIDFVSAVPSQASTNPGVISWDYDDLQPFESRIVSIVVNLNSPMETPPVVNGQQLNYNVSGAIAEDTTPNDNQFTLKQIVVGSFDPNDKTCLEGAVVSPEKIGDFLHYLIRFENTGTAAAQNIVVKDIIDAAQFDVASLQVLSSSHEMAARFSGNRTEFIFEGIQLAPEATGYVLFKIKTLAGLQTGSTVVNKADIFFDYNFPVETNDAETTFQSLSTDDFNVASIALYPNPTKNEFTVKSASDLKSVQIFDVQGRLLETHVGTSTEMQVSLHSKSKGVYFVKAISEKGNAVIRIVKE